MSAHAIQVELDAGRLAVPDVVGMPKWLDGCFLQRRKQALGGLNARFRQFVVERGAELAACRSL